MAEKLHDADMEAFKYLGWVTHLLNTHDLWEEDGSYTFPDGETVHIFDPIGDSDA